MRHESDRFRPIEQLESEMRDRLAAKDAEIARLKEQRDRLAEAYRWQVLTQHGVDEANRRTARFGLRVSGGKVEEIGNG